MINTVIPISIQTWPCLMGHLGYQNILQLPKVADGIDVKGFILREILWQLYERLTTKETVL